MDQWCSDKNMEIDPEESASTGSDHDETSWRLAARGRRWLCRSFDRLSGSVTRHARREALRRRRNRAAAGVLSRSIGTSLAQAHAARGSSRAGPSTQRQVGVGSSSGRSVRRLRTPQGPRRGCFLNKRKKKQGPRRGCSSREDRRGCCMHGVQGGLT